MEHWINGQQTQSTAMKTTNLLMFQRRTVPPPRGTPSACGLTSMVRVCTSGGTQTAQQPSLSSTCGLPVTPETSRVSAWTCRVASGGTAHVSRTVTSSPSARRRCQLQPLEPLLLPPLPPPPRPQQQPRRTRVLLMVGEMETGLTCVAMWTSQGTPAALRGWRHRSTWPGATWTTGTLTAWSASKGRVRYILFLWTNPYNGWRGSFSPLSLWNKQKVGKWTKMDHAV